MTLAMRAAPTNLDPLAGYAPFGAAKIFDGLVEHEPDGSLRPTLAAEPPTPSADGLSWTVRLRENVTFSDGSTLGADDVVATYRALLDPAVASPLRPDYDMLSGVTKLNATKVRFDLSRRDPNFANLLTLGILPGGSLAHPAPAASSPVGTRPVGTGPYRVKEFRPGKKLVLTANPSYFGNAPKVKTVTVRLGRNAASRERAVASGAVDGACLPASTLAKHGTPDGYRKLTDPAADTLAISLPTSGDVTGDASVRQALNHAVDRKALLAGPLAGAGSVASTPITDVQPEFQQPSATFSRDPRKARAVLKKAGWSAGDGGTRAKGGVSASFPVYYAAGDPVAHAVLTAVAHDAAGIGLDVEPKAVPAGELAGHRSTDPVLIRAGNPFDPVRTWYPLLHSGGADNVTGYHDGDVDAALERARTAADPAQRAVALRAFQRAYVDDPAMVVLARADHACVQRDLWTGYQQVTDPAEVSVAWGPWWNLAAWQPQ